MARLYGIEPWRLGLVGGFAGFAYAFTPHSMARGGSLLPLVVLILTLDQLVGHRTGRSVVGQAGFLIAALGLSALELSLLRPSVQPRMIALFAVTFALLQLVIFLRAARSLQLPLDSTRRRTLVRGWAALSVVVPPATILTAGYAQLALQLAWTMSGIVPSFLVLKALDRPGPRAASIGTP